ncbi:hypothetical protein EF294_03295 [Gordonia oryzae]|uniref:Uncharacterized protein n=1 Tax=Gordonia oryzae TaxID=2487349 RepID=A0A3N4GTX0_9ACTN|nr:hypothetical protein [Gordonia oryzae]RPA65775.1 hypothetical protein EF294_03295 [Gordonia oryzae]
MSELRDLDDILDDRRHLAYVSDGTSGSEKVGRLLNDVAPLVDEVRRLHNVIERVREYLENDCGPFIAADGFQSFRGADRSRLLAILADAEGSGQRANGFAVVELPKPTDTYNHLTETSMMGWEIPSWEHFVETIGNEVQLSYNGEPEEPFSSEVARAFAAALLAAADAADRAGDDGEGR